MSAERIRQPSSEAAKVDKEKSGNSIENMRTLPELEEDVDADLGNVAGRVLEGPHDRVDDELEVLLRYHEEGLEAALVDRSQQDEELKANQRIAVRSAPDQ